MGRPGGMREAIEHLNIYLCPLPPALDVAPILKVGIEELWHISAITMMGRTDSM